MPDNIEYSTVKGKKSIAKSSPTHPGISRGYFPLSLPSRKQLVGWGANTFYEPNYVRIRIIVGKTKRSGEGENEDKNSQTFPHALAQPGPRSFGRSPRKSAWNDFSIVGSRKCTTCRNSDWTWCWRCNWYILMHWELVHQCFQVIQPRLSHAVGELTFWNFNNDPKTSSTFSRNY